MTVHGRALLVKRTGCQFALNHRPFSRRKLWTPITPIRGSLLQAETHVTGSAPGPGGQTEARAYVRQDGRAIGVERLRDGDSEIRYRGHSRSSFPVLLHGGSVGLAEVGPASERFAIHLEPSGDPVVRVVHEGVEGQEAELLRRGAFVQARGLRVENLQGRVCPVGARHPTRGVDFVAPDEAIYVREGCRELCRRETRLNEREVLGPRHGRHWT